MRIFLCGGNTYRLLAGLKASGCFEKIADYIRHDGVVFGGSAGAILFGADIDSCACDGYRGLRCAKRPLPPMPLYKPFGGKGSAEHRVSSGPLKAKSHPCAAGGKPDLHQRGRNRSDRCPTLLCIQKRRADPKKNFIASENGGIKRIVRRLCKRCRPPKLLWLDKLKAGNLCIPGFVFSLPRAKAKADG
mgnify:CR=1 FL=1